LKEQSFLIMKPLKILVSDTEWHSPFFQFVAMIFRGSEAKRWQLWRDRGGWTEQYEIFTIVDGDRIVSTIGRTRMQLVVNGETRVGYQLGAVATLNSYRQQGSARQLMDWVIDGLDEPDQPMLLFANNSVRDFYPRFGFRRIRQRRSVARVSINPSDVQALRCDPAKAADRSRLANLCALARPIRGPLAARDYYSVLLWHLSCRPVIAFWLPEFDAVIAVTAKEGRLIVRDVIAMRPFDLSLVIPTLIACPITDLEFGFDPEDWWPTADHSEFDDADSSLFVRGVASIASPVQFPELAHT
jgi:predicted N-acetyltransferase YhbS